MVFENHSSIRPPRTDFTDCFSIRLPLIKSMFIKSFIIQIRSWDGRNYILRLYILNESSQNHIISPDSFLIKRSNSNWSMKWSFSKIYNFLLAYAKLSISGWNARAYSQRRVRDLILLTVLRLPILAWRPAGYCLLPWSLAKVDKSRRDWVCNSAKKRIR